MTFSYNTKVHKSNRENVSSFSIIAFRSGIGSETQLIATTQDLLFFYSKSQIDGTVY